MATLVTPRNLSSWRYAYNPIVGLTMARLVNLLNIAEEGYYADITWLYRFVEKRDAVLRAVKSRRLSALKKLDWSIKVKAKFSPEDKNGNSKPSDKAKRQQEFLHESYEQVDNLKAATEFLALADFRGFAHLEKHYFNNQPDEGVNHLEPVPQWYWARQMPNPRWFYNRHATSTNRGVPIDPQHFIIREVDSAIDEVAAICFLRKNMSQKDWDGFVETFGIPPLFIELPMGTGTNGSEAYQEIIEKVIGDARGVLPNGAKIASVPDGQRGGRPFQEHISYQDEQIVMAATGGLLTALTQATGMNEGQSGNHKNAFDDIAAAEALMISEAFQTQHDKLVLDREFPGEEVMVYFELAHQDIGETNRVITDAQELNSAGYEMDVGQLAEKTGYRLKLKRELEAEAQQAQMEQQAKIEKEQAEAAAKSEAPKTSEPDWAGLGFGDAEMNRLKTLTEGVRKTVESGDAILNRELERISDMAGSFVAAHGIETKKAIRYGDGLANRMLELVKKNS